MVNASPAATSPKADTAVLLVPPNNLVIDSDRIRTDLGDIEQLSESIKEVGIIHPIVVDPDGKVLDGVRRTTAAQLLGLVEVPVIIRDYADERQVELHANNHRKPFNPEEIGKFAYEQWDDPRWKRFAGAKRDILGHYIGVSGVHLERCKKLYERFLNGDTEIMQLANEKGAVAAERVLKEAGASRNRLASLTVYDGEVLDTIKLVPQGTAQMVATVIPRPRAQSDIVASVLEAGGHVLEPAQNVAMIVDGTGLPDLLSLIDQSGEWHVVAIDPINDKNHIWFAVSASRVATSSITARLASGKGTPSALAAWVNAVLPDRSRIIDPFAGFGALASGMDGHDVVAITSTTSPEDLVEAFKEVADYEELITVAEKGEDVTVTSSEPEGFVDNESVYVPDEESYTAYGHDDTE